MTLRLHTLAASLLLLICSSIATAEAPLKPAPTAIPKAPDFPRTALHIGMYRVDAEVAATEPARQYGLMYRKTMPGNAGMLFVFQIPQQYCMWMKNTFLPLSVAFIDEAGRITNIEDMKPQTEESHCAARPARYALEMNKGWFKDKGFKAGTKIDGLPR